MNTNLRLPADWGTSGHLFLIRQRFDIDSTILPLAEPLD